MWIPGEEWAIKKKKKKRSITSIPEDAHLPGRALRHAVLGPHSAGRRGHPLPSLNQEAKWDKGHCSSLYETAVILPSLGQTVLILPVE